MLKSIKIKYVKNLTIIYNIYKQPQIQGQYECSWYK